MVPRAPRTRGVRTPSRRVSSWVFLGEVHHERTKQTLARLRPGSTGGSARGYERSRVPRPEYLKGRGDLLDHLIGAGEQCPGDCAMWEPNFRERNAFYEWTIAADDTERRRVGRALRNCVGNEVRKLYADVPNEPIPSKIADLLHRLDQ